MKPPRAQALAAGATEDALRGSSERFRIAFESAPIGMLLADADGRLLLVNDALAAMLGYSRDELLARTWQDITHPDDLEESRVHAQRLLNGEIETYQLEKRYVGKDGGIVWVHLTISAVREVDGSLRYNIAQIQDVTQQREAEASLRRRDAVLHAVASSAERLLRTSDFRRVIGEVLEALGTSAGASRCYVFENHEDPEGRTCTSQRFEWCADGVEPQAANPTLQDIALDDPDLAPWRDALERGRGYQAHVSTLPERRRSRLAAQRIFSLLAVPITVEGRWWGFIGFDDCLAERTWSPTEVEALRAAAGALGAAIQRQEAETSRHEAEERYRTLVESLPLVTYVDRADDQISGIYVSPQVESLLGYSPEEWLSDPGFFGRMLHADDRESAYEGDWPEGPGPHVYEYRLMHRDGRPVWIHDQYLLVHDDQGKPLYSQGFMIDITERKRAEEELCRRDAVLEAVAAGGELLLAARDWEDAIDDVLRQLGVAAGASRSYVFERTEADGIEVLSQRYEWCAQGIEPAIDREKLQALPLGAPGFEHVHEELAAGRVVQGHREDFSGDLRAELEAEGIHSILLVPIFAGDRWWGVCGFDECAAQRVWTRAEIEALRAAAGILGGAVHRQRAEAGRREAEERYRALVEHLPFVTYVSDVAGGPPRYVSPQVEAMLGYPLERWLSERFFLGEIVDPDDLETVTTRLEPADGPVTTEFRAQASDGRTVWVRDTYLLVRDEAGRPLYGQGFMIDVTERRQMIEALRETNETLQTLVDASPISIVVLDLEDRVMLWNQAAERTFGWTAAEVLGKYLPTRLPELEHEHRLFQETVMRGDRIVSFETRRRRKDARTIDVSISIAPVRNAAGDAVGSLAAHVDITEAKRAEQALRERERQFRAVFDSSRDALWIVDDDRRLVEANQAAAELYGLTRPELVGRTLDDLAPAAQHADLDAMWRSLSDRGEIEFDWELVRADAGRRALEAAGKANFLPGRHLFVARDVTERKALEAQLLHSQRMDAVGRLAGGVAHDFNNLLTAIQGYSDFLLAELPAGSEPWSDAEQIARAAERAETLVRQLLAFSRKQMLQPEVVDLNGVVRDIESMLRRLIGEDIELVTALDPALQCIHADAAQVEQTIINLAVNGREAMPHGGSLRLETANADVHGVEAERLGLPPGSYVRIAVQDTGTGMDEATRLRAFEPFFTTKEQGTGLGLSTVYGIVTQSGGQVDVQSQPGQGTVFSVYFPAVPTPKRWAVEGSEGEPSPNGGSETVLLVEDEDVVRGLAHRVLSDSGYRVLEAESGEEALRLADGHQGAIDLLLTDVVMPGMNGRELADRLLELRPGLRILYMSGYTEDAVIQRGVSDDRAFLAKPFSPGDLTSTVRVILDTPVSRSLS